MRLVGVLITRCQYPLNDNGLQESMLSTFLPRSTGTVVRFYAYPLPLRKAV